MLAHFYGFDHTQGVIMGYIVKADYIFLNIKIRARVRFLSCSPPLNTVLI